MEVEKEEEEEEEEEEGDGEECGGMESRVWEAWEVEGVAEKAAAAEGKGNKAACDLILEVRR